MFKQKCVLGMALVLLAVAGCSGKSRKPGDGPHVRFVAPEVGTQLTGLAELRLEATLEQPVTRMNLLVDGTSVDSYTNLMSSLRLDTTHFSDGATQLGVEVQTEDGKTYSDSLDVVIDNPEHRLVRAVQNQYGYGKGEQIVIELEYSAPHLAITADLSAIDTAFSAANVRVEELGDGRYQVRYTVSDANTREAGRYDIEVSSTGSDDITLKSAVNVHFLGAPRLPLAFPAEGATFTDRGPAITIAPDAPSVQIVQAPETLIEGANDSITVSWTAPESNPTDRIILRSPSFSGAWVVPLAAPSTSGSMQIPATVSSNATGLSTGAVILSASGVGVNGTSADTVEHEMRVVMMSQAGMRVMLSWTGDADLDLAVTTPDKSRIDYDSPSGQGGTFERDSNSLCAKDLPPLESIVWGVNNVVPGPYGIEVSMFDNCGQSQVNYEVLVYACGQIQRIPGTFSSAAANSTQYQTLAPFVVDCMQRLTGRVVYDKVSPGSSDAFPAVQVPVRVMGTGAADAPSTITNDNGEYDVTFPAFLGQNVWLEIDAAWMPLPSSTPRAKVVGMSGNKTAAVISTVGPLTSSIQTHDAMITVADGSGAFNILEITRRSYAWVARNFFQSTAALVRDLVVHWEAGKDTPAEGSYNDCGQNKPWLWISGGNLDPKKNNPDEFDDSVTAHEFGHCFARSLGLDDSTGGDHDFDSQIIPRFAWSEGLATAIGQTVLETPEMRCTGRSSVGFVDIEMTLGDASKGRAFGTARQGDVTSNVNEFLVAAVLWDLLDPLSNGNDIDDDRISTSDYAVYGSLSRYLRFNDWVKRGAGGHDLVDFLDGWRCLEGLDAARNGTSPRYAELAGLLKTRNFPYAPPTAAVTCH